MQDFKNDFIIHSFKSIDIELINGEWKKKPKGIRTDWTSLTENQIKKGDKAFGLLTGEKTLKIEAELLKQNLFVKAILAPTVRKGKERIRICFHDFNTLNEIKLLVNILNNMV